MAIAKNSSFIVRFDDEAHRERAIKRAKETGRSLNKHILYLINKDLKLKVK